MQLQYNNNILFYNNTHRNDLNRFNGSFGHGFVLLFPEILFGHFQQIVGYKTQKAGDHHEKKDKGPLSHRHTLDVFVDNGLGRAVGLARVGAETRCFRLFCHEALCGFDGLVLAEHECAAGRFRNVRNAIKYHHLGIITRMTLCTVLLLYCILLYCFVERMRVL